MLILENKGASEGNPVSSQITEGSGDVLPPYESAPVPLPSGSPAHFLTSHSTLVPERPANVIPTNFTKIKRTNSSIKGIFVINAGLTSPDDELVETPRPALSSSAADGQERTQPEPKKNLSLQCTNSSITAEVWLIDDGAESYQDGDMHRAELELKSVNGSINLKLRSTTTRPFSLSAKSGNASVTVALPPDFVGPVNLNTVHGSLTLSKTMQSRLVVFSEENGKRKCFVGDYRAAGYTGVQSWTGSMAEVGSVNGSVKLSFVDEVDHRNSNGGGGFFRRLFGGAL